MEDLIGNTIPDEGPTIVSSYVVAQKQQSMEMYSPVYRMIKIYENQIPYKRRNPLVKNKGNIKDDWTYNLWKQSTLLQSWEKHVRNMT